MNPPRGWTVILCTHYIEEAHELCDRIAIVDAGRIVAEGKPDQLIAGARLPQVVFVKTSALLDASTLAALPEVTAVEPAEQGWRLTTDNITRCIVNVVQLVESQNLQLIDLQIRRPRLEDVFLQLTGRAMDGFATDTSAASTANGLPSTIRR
jgi:ABC-2 type transport system ATP-binding protein